jgi:hypothetical protein
VASAVVLFWIWPCLALDNLGKETGARLLERCEPAQILLAADTAAFLSGDQYADAMSCIGFVEGFLWGHGWAAWREGRDMYYCPPEAASAKDAVPVLTAYLQAHPERQDAPAHVLLFAALSNAWPCTPMPPR